MTPNTVSLVSGLKKVFQESSIKTVGKNHSSPTIYKKSPKGMSRIELGKLVSEDLL